MRVLSSVVHHVGPRASVVHFGKTLLPQEEGGHTAARTAGTNQKDVFVFWQFVDARANLRQRNVDASRRITHCELAG